MRGYVLDKFDRLARRAAKTAFGGFRGRAGFDILEASKLKAALDTAEYYEQHALHAKAFPDDLALLSFAASFAPKDGLIVEFGVASGKTVNHLARIFAPRPVYGFDSFEGLPETWRTDFERGRFAQALPQVEANVELIKGWFEDTLSTFLESHSGPIAFLHVDCDLYSSTKTVLNLLADRMSKGSVIVFDEYWNYPGWRNHEFKAFSEFVARYDVKVSYEAFVPSHEQVCILVA